MELKTSDSFYYRLTSNDEDIFNKFNTCKENVFRNNPNIKFYAGEWVKIKVNDYVVCHVKPMDTLENIAKRYMVDCEKLIRDNNLKTNKLFIGQCLKIYK